MHRPSPVSVLARAALAFTVLSCSAAGLAGCARQGEGDVCNPQAADNGTADCQGGLVCTQIASVRGSRCCPADRANATGVCASGQSNFATDAATDADAASGDASDASTDTDASSGGEFDSTANALEAGLDAPSDGAEGSFDASSDAATEAASSLSSDASANDAADADGSSETGASGLTPE